MTCFKKFLLLTTLVVAGCADPSIELKRINLDQWEFRQEGGEKWLSATVPGVVHTDLLDHGLISDPWIGRNELDVQWIENENWEYKSVFELSAEELDRNRIDLIFEGLDTYAEVTLNDSLILSADNMFRSWRVDVKKLLKLENELIIKFSSPIEVNKNNSNLLGYQLPAPNEPVDIKVSPFTRKAPYHFGWDWGARLVTSGIWRPVYLESWDLVRIEDVHAEQKMLSDNQAEISFNILIESEASNEIQVSLNELDTLVTLEVGENMIQIPMVINDPKRWWPNGWGDPNLYDIRVALRDDYGVVDIYEMKIGLRTVELIQEKDSIGESFYFKINGQPLFARGANYIPQSHFLPSVKKEDYSRLINQAKRAGMNMIRVWGGGIYENDYFYELCDQNGILVWQDFMFACSMYPGDEAFVQSVKMEVEDNVKRLRNHPSIIHWNGNNEVEVAWKNWGWQNQYQFAEKDSTQMWEDYLKLFHKTIPSIVKKLDDRPYSTTSPLSNWGRPENFDYGSMHYWGVWHGSDDFEDYYENVGRFMSEYGFQSFPNMETIGYFADSSEWSLDSKTMIHHQKSYIGNGLIAEQATKYFGEPVDFEDFVQKSQQAQALAMQMAIDAHRLKKGHCWGTLFWQLNDCWPGPSWSAVDVFGREKKFYEELEVLYAPVALIPQWDDEELVITLVNDSLKSIEAVLQIVFFKGEEPAEKIKHSVVIDSNGIEEVYRGLPASDVDRVEMKLIVDQEVIFSRSVLR